MQWVVAANIFRFFFHLLQSALLHSLNICFKSSLYFSIHFYINDAFY